MIVGARFGKDDLNSACLSFNIGLIGYSAYKLGNN